MNDHIYECGPQTLASLFFSSLTAFCLEGPQAKLASVPSCFCALLPDAPCVGACSASFVPFTTVIPSVPSSIPSLSSSSKKGKETKPAKPSTTTSTTTTAPAKPTAAPMSVVAVDEETALKAIDAALGTSTSHEVTSEALAAQLGGVNHQLVIGLLNGFAAREMVVLRVAERLEWQLNDEAQQIAAEGSHEAKVYEAVPATGSIAQDELNKALGATAKIGVGKALKAGWVELKNGQLSRKAASIIDVVCFADSFTVRGSVACLPACLL